MYHYILKGDNNKAVAIKSEALYYYLKDMLEEQTKREDGKKVLHIFNDTFVNPRLMTKDDFCEYLPFII